MKEELSRVLSVNEVIASLDKWDGQSVRIACVLNLEFEDVSVWHLPASERLPGYESRLWAEFEGSGGYLDPLYKRFHRRHVIVTGTIDRDERGHMSLWPGGIRVHSVQK